MQPKTETAPTPNAEASSKPEPSGDAAEGIRYTCPMHPEIDASKPGACPKCGMKLVPKKVEK